MQEAWKVNKYAKIGIALAIIGSVLAVIGLISAVSTSANTFAFLTSNSLPILLLGIIGLSLLIIGVILIWFGPNLEIAAAKPAKPVKREVAAKKVKPAKKKVAAKPVKPVRKKVAAKPAKEEEEEKEEVDLSLVEKLPVIKIEGIGPIYSEKLNTAGIKTMRELMKAGRKAGGREELAQKTGISKKLILEWIRDADFSRIKGVSVEYSDLLDEADVKDVVDLAKRNAYTLHPMLLETAKRKRIVRRIPGLNQVSKWIDQAKQLPKLIEY